MTIPCTITHVEQVGDPDEYGDPTEETTTTVLDGSPGCWFHQDYRSDAGFADRSSAGQLSNIETERWTVYVPAGTSLDANDTITIQGNTYQVVGPPWSANNPREQRDVFVVASLERTA